ncbi:MAG: hypothetical protein ABGX47_10960 [Martelella sp.]|uniref:hypothetical protein n=1 Tax=Martelella sp. TaxID=1969699 RepID=UPI003242FE94
MANADKKHFGEGAKGKSSGTGAMTDLEDEVLPKDKVLSNRDKARHSEARGLDGKNVQNEGYKDHSANRRDSD